MAPHHPHMAPHRQDQALHVSACAPPLGQLPRLTLSQTPPTAAAAAAASRRRTHLHGLSRRPLFTIRPVPPTTLPERKAPMAAFTVEPEGICTSSHSRLATRGAP